MASIPLLCNICPKQPDFSDISHLLTHVGSKGHLSHYFKTQVRSRQDPTVRQQLDTYDKWYVKHQIEKLLSQRMALKESKDIKAKPKVVAKRTPTGVASSTSKKSTKAAFTSRKATLELKAETVIDPQLSQLPFLPEHIPLEKEIFAVRDQPPYDLASKHRAYVPPMQRHLSLSPAPHDVREAPAQPEALGVENINRENNVDDDDDDGDSIQSRIETSYPDPTMLSSHSPILLSDSSPRHITKDPCSLQLGKGSDESMCAARQAYPIQSPKLKGIQYPGMDMFDSASLEAQRKRNQKKTTSIIEQMEQSSASVEPLERIYWPEGGLKKQRIITGMVESSPIKDDSPVTKRRRSAGGRVVLGSLSTNKPRDSKRPKARKQPNRIANSCDADLGDLSKRALAMLEFPSIEQGETNTMFETLEGADVPWRHHAEDRGHTFSHEFVIFNDDLEEYSTQPHDYEPMASEYPAVSSAYSSSKFINPSSSSSHDLGITFSPDQSFSSHLVPYAESMSRTKDPKDRHRPPVTSCSISMASKENIEPILDPRGQIENQETRIPPKRSTQRYFSTHGSRSPEYFDFLPPHMDFGGLTESRLYGSCPNPLNASFHLQPSQIQRYQNSDVHAATTTATKPQRRRHAPDSWRIHTR